MKKKNPNIAAILSLIFGPFGYIYIGWKYFIVALFIFFIFSVVFILIGFDPSFLPQSARFWLKIPILLVLSWKAHTICFVRNNLIDKQGGDVKLLNTFEIVTGTMTDLLIGIGKVYAGVLGLYASIISFSEGNFFWGIIFLIAIPLLVYVFGIIFTLITMGIDTIVIFIKTRRK